MKILLLQLSDLHTKDKSISSEEFVSRIIKSLRELPKFDQASIILSGDLAFSGKQHEYEHLKNFIGKLITNIRKEFWNNELKKIEIIAVPGNHDILFPSAQRNRVDAKKLVKDFNANIDNELKLQDNFFDFAMFNGCFIKNKIVDVKNVSYDGYEIQFNLINSALFSTLNDENDDNDKEIHHIPEEYISLLKRSKSSSACITVLHHNTDWFDWTTKKMLEENINKDSTILFVGHEHIPQTAFSTIDGNLDCLIAKGGTFNDPSIEDNFISIIFDTENHQISTYAMNFNEDVFNVTNRDNKVLDIPLRYKDFILNKSFIYFLNESVGEGINPDSIFVFPTLKKSKTDEFNENKQIESYDEFIKAIENKDLCIIEGNELSGKSLLLKYIYKKSFTRGIPLFVDSNNILKNDNVDNLIKRTFEEQYGSNRNLFSKYCQLGKEEKIIFIDNLDKIKDKLTFISKLQKKYGLIFASSKPVQYDVRDLVLDSTKPDNKFIEFIIEPFYYEKRMRLIKNICSSLYNEADAHLIEEKTKDINDFICEQLKLFNISPYFILAYSTNYIRRPKGSSDKLNVFGEVFRSNIVQNFTKTTDINVNTAFFILGEISLKIFKDRIYPLPVSDLINIIDKYNKDYDQKINALNFIKALEESKILSSIDGTQTYKFSSDNILAFFIAKKIVDLYGHPDVTTFIQHLITFICFGINSEILMFVISLKNDWGLLKLILDQVVDLTKDWEEFSFGKNNLTFLNNDIKETVLSAPTSTSKKEAIKKEESRERKIKNSQLETINIFDYTEDDLKRFINLETCAIKSLTLVSTLYANFYYLIPAPNKIDFLDYIFKQPNKIIYYMFSPFDENFNEFIDGLYNEIKEESSEITKEDIIDLFLKISEITMLNIYYCSSHRIGTEETIESLTKYVEKSKSINNEIQLILTFEHMERLKQFGEHAEKLENETSLSIIKDMVKRMVHHYFLWNTVPLKGYGQHLATKYFKNNKKTLKKIQNRSIRKKK